LFRSEVRSWSKQHILVIDDDQGLVRMISEYLTAEGFEVSAAYSGSEGLATFRQNGPDLILLDWMLPEKSGIDVCREIREDSQIPIIMLTARGEEPDKVVGLELGADDYVTKPFSLRELIARIRTVLRRVDAHTQISSKKVVVGPLEVDVEGLTVYWAGHPVSLTATEYKILTAMAPHPNRVFSRSQLIE